MRICIHRYPSFLVCLFLLLMVWQNCFAELLVNAIAGPEITRGPYLQAQTQTSVVVRWRTAILASSKVYFGRSVKVLDASVQDDALKTEHEIVLTGLSPDTKYYYTVDAASY